MIGRTLLDRYFIKAPRFRRLCTTFIYGESDTEVTILGVQVMVNSMEENGYLRASRLSQRSSFLQDELAVIIALSNLMDERVAFIDAGANVGMFSSILSRLRSIYPTFQAYAFEVNPSTFKRLEANANLHGFEAHQIGLSDRTCTQSFIRGAVSHVTAVASEANAYQIKGTEFVAECQPLRAFVFAQPELIIKIDVEGHELQVLLGAEPFFREKRVRAVYVDGYSDPRVVDFLKSYEFGFFNGRDLKSFNEGTFSLLALRETGRRQSD